jgi:peptidyl-tRNA hydrolase
VGDIEYVLGKFTADEKKLIEEAVTNTQTAVRDFLSNGLEWTMSHYN